MLARFKLYGKECIPVNPALPKDNLDQIGAPNTKTSKFRLFADRMSLGGTIAYVSDIEVSRDVGY
jgi:hypothetical protein